MCVTLCVSIALQSEHRTTSALSHPHKFPLVEYGVIIMLYEKQKEVASMGASARRIIYERTIVTERQKRSEGSSHATFMGRGEGESWRMRRGAVDV